MDKNSYTTKNCLQWALRVLTPKNYVALLKRYAIELSPDVYEQIKQDHMNEGGGPWWLDKWLGCEILETGKWINIATGRRIADWCHDRIATFPTWESYEGFREALRKATAKRLRANPHLF
jgi:hypothetical protein